MTADPLVLVAELDRATDRLLSTAGTLTDLAAPSLCPGWTRGHVLTHLSRNADGHLNLLAWARTGVETPMYPSPEAREAGIAAGADRPLDEQVSDLTTSAARLHDAILDMPAAAWTTQVRLGSGPAPAARIVWNRLLEVEIHHVDLDAGYSYRDWPASFSARLLHESPPPAGVTGTDNALAAWLIGRSDGSDLTADPPGHLPPVPSWK